jgi:uncharacterized protein (TIGR02118 family)
MIKVSILYPNKPGSHFDVEYYLNSHMPLASRLLEPALKAVQVEIAADGASPDQVQLFAAIVGFTCESLAAFDEAFQLHAAELRADIPNYTDIEPIIQVSTIRIG